MKRIILKETKKRNGKWIMSPEYQAWCSMKGRCYNPKHQRYNYYGARGITVYDSWRNSFMEFLKDMGRRPSPQYSLDRMNNNGNYEPGNCKWSTKAEQMNNTRVSNKLYWETLYAKIKSEDEK
jgi:hypothetical protein